MFNPIIPIDIDSPSWRLDETDPEWIAALEAGKVLYFPRLQFVLGDAERRFLTPGLNAPDSRSITLDAGGRLKGALGDAAQLAEVAAMIARFRGQAQALVNTLLPRYLESLQTRTTSYRPLQVETRAQSWRGDDRRLHVDAFAGRPNHGERILRVFTNVNPDGAPRVWRVGEPFEDVARHFLPHMQPYRAWHARVQQVLRKTKKLRTEYDHLMLQLHDCMKSDPDYQERAPQFTMQFAAGSAWVCFSDLTPHAVMSGQYMMEQTFALPVASQYAPEASPLAILTRLAGHALV